MSIFEKPFPDMPEYTPSSEYILMQELATKLDCGHINAGRTTHFDKRVASAADAINERPGNRSLEQIVESTARGFASEYAVAHILNANLNANEFNHCAPETYEADLILSTGELIEIKSYLPTYVNGKEQLKGTWNFSNNLDTFESRAFALDYVIFCSSETIDYETFTIVPRLIANAKTFFDYVQINRNNTGSFYKDGVARTAQQCIKIRTF